MRPELEHISSWDFAREIQPGVYVHDDYDLERPSVELQDAEGRCRAATRRATTRSTTIPGTTCRRPTASSTRRCASTSSAASSRRRRRSTNAQGICVGSLFTLEDYPRDDQNREHLILAASYDLEFSDYEAMPEGGGTSYRCSFVAMSSKQQFRPQRVDAQAVRAGAADRGGRRPGRRRDLHRQVRPREGAVPLGPLRQEGREQLVLDPRVAAVGRQGLGRGLDAAHRPGGDRRLPRRRSRPADHHRPRLQRRADAALRAAGEQDAERIKSAQLEGRRRRRTSTRSGSRTRRARSRSSSTPRRTRTSRSRTTRRTGSGTIGPRRSTTTRRRTSSTIGRRRSTTTRRSRSRTTETGRRDIRRSTETTNETITIGGNRTITVSKSETATVALQRTHTVGDQRDDHRRRGAGDHRRRRRRPSPSVRQQIDNSRGGPIDQRRRQSFSERRRQPGDDHRCRMRR